MAIISSRLYAEPIVGNVGEVLESVSNEGIYQACAESHFGMCKLCEAIMMADVALEESVYDQLLEADESDASQEEKEEKKEEVKAEANEKAEGAKESFKEKALALIEKIKKAAIDFYEKLVAAFRKAFRMDALVAHTEAELEGLTIPAGAKVKLELPNLAEGNKIVDAAVKMLESFLTSALSDGTDPVNFGKNLEEKANVEKVRAAYKASEATEIAISKEQIRGSIAFLKKKEEMLKSIDAEKDMVVKACESAAKTLKASKEGDVSKLAKVVEGCCSRISKMLSIKASMYKEAYSAHNKYLFAAVKVSKGEAKADAKEEKPAEEKPAEGKEEATKESSALDMWFNFDTTEM